MAYNTFPIFEDSEFITSFHPNNEAVAFHIPTGKIFRFVDKNNKKCGSECMQYALKRLRNELLISQSINVFGFNY